MQSLLTIFVFIVVGIWIVNHESYVQTNSAWEQKLVERGLAGYCPVDGQWAWKGECVDGRAP